MSEVRIIMEMVIINLYLYFAAVSLLKIKTKVIKKG